VEVLLAQDLISTSLAVMALEAHKSPEVAAQVRVLLGEILGAIQGAEERMRIYRAE
jgi:hypothetical protein